MAKFKKRQWGLYSIPSSERKRIKEIILFIVRHSKDRRKLNGKKQRKLHISTLTVLLTAAMAHYQFSDVINNIPKEVAEKIKDIYDRELAYYFRKSRTIIASKLHRIAEKTGMPVHDMNFTQLVHYIINCNEPPKEIPYTIDLSAYKYFTAGDLRVFGKSMHPDNEEEQKTLEELKKRIEELNSKLDISNLEKKGEGEKVIGAHFLNFPNLSYQKESENVARTMIHVDIDDWKRCNISQLVNILKKYNIPFHVTKNYTFAEYKFSHRKHDVVIHGDPKRGRIIIFIEPIYNPKYSFIAYGDTDDKKILRKAHRDKCHFDELYYEKVLELIQEIMPGAELKKCQGFLPPAVMYRPEKDGYLDPFTPWLKYAIWVALQANISSTYRYLAAFIVAEAILTDKAALHVLTDIYAGTPPTIKYLHDILAKELNKTKSLPKIHARHVPPDIRQARAQQLKQKRKTFSPATKALLNYLENTIQTIFTNADIVGHRNEFAVIIASILARYTFLTASTINDFISTQFEKYNDEEAWTSSRRIAQYTIKRYRTNQKTYGLTKLHNFANSFNITLPRFEFPEYESTNPIKPKKPKKKTITARTDTGSSDQLLSTRRITEFFIYAINYAIANLLNDSRHWKPILIVLYNGAIYRVSRNNRLYLTGKTDFYDLQERPVTQDISTLEDDLKTLTLPEIYIKHRKNIRAIITVSTSQDFPEECYNHNCPIEKSDNAPYLIFYGNRAAAINALLSQLVVRRIYNDTHIVFANISHVLGGSPHFIQRRFKDFCNKYHMYAGSIDPKTHNHSARKRRQTPFVAFSGIESVIHPIYTKYGYYTVETMFINKTLNIEYKVVNNEHPLAKKSEFYTLQIFYNFKHPKAGYPKIDSYLLCSKAHYSSLRYSDDYAYSQLPYKTYADLFKEYDDTLLRKLGYFNSERVEMFNFILPVRWKHPSIYKCQIPQQYNDALTKQTVTYIQDPKEWKVIFTAKEADGKRLKLAKRQRYGCRLKNLIFSDIAVRLFKFLPVLYYVYKYILRRFLFDYILPKVRYNGYSHYVESIEPLKKFYRWYGVHQDDYEWYTGTGPRRRRRVVHKLA